MPAIAQDEDPATSEGVGVRGHSHDKAGPDGHQFKSREPDVLLFTAMPDSMLVDQQAPADSPDVKPAVSRGARACSVCRAAKVYLYCRLRPATRSHFRPDEVRRRRGRRREAVPALPPLECRVSRPVVCAHTTSNALSRCVFEKHRRGRKPGSK